MEFTQEDIEILDKFFRNDLKGEELTSLQSRMKDPEFAAEVKLYLESIREIENSGRAELRSVLSSIHNEMERVDGFDEYKSSKGKGGSGSGGIVISILITITAVVAYLFYTGKIDLGHIEKTFPFEEKIDTVYHYNIVRDTIGPKEGGTIIKNQIIKTDTVFVREKIITPAKENKLTPPSESAIPDSLNSIQESGTHMYTKDGKIIREKTNSSSIIFAKPEKGKKDVPLDTLIER